jgi:HD-like signal output (HDOD) protein
MQLDRDRVIKALQKVEKLPAFPEIVLRVERELSQPDASIRKLVVLLQQDAGLVANVLRAANSAYYAGNAKIASVEQAAVRLGLRQVRQIISASAVVTKYRNIAKAHSMRFWGHSLAVAMTARALLNLCQQAIPTDDQESLFVAGLLHDLGLLALLHLFPAEYETLLAQQHEQGGDSSSLETAAWGVEHGEAGAILVSRWALPPPVEQAIRFHHKPWLAGPEHRAAVQLVHIADFVCNNQGFNRDDAEFPNWFDPQAWDSLGLSMDQCSVIVERVRAEGERSVVLTKALMA